MSARESSEPCARLLGWARRVLDPAVVSRVVEPCVADVRHEHAEHLAHGDRTAARRVAREGALTVLGLVLRLRLARRVDDAARVSWWGLAPALATALLAVVAMSAARPGSARAQLVFVAFGVVGAALAATTSRRTLRRATRPAAVVVIGALVAVLAIDHEGGLGARRWLAVGPLRVHVAALVTPVFVLATSGLLAARRTWTAIALVALSLGLVALQPDVASTVVLATAALASSWVALPAPRRAGVGLTIAAAALAAAAFGVFVMPSLRPGELPPDGGLDLLLARGAPWLFGGLGGLLLTVLSAVHMASRRPRSSDTGMASFDRALAAGLVGAMAAQPLAAFLGGDGVHLLSPGGSGVVAAFVAIGLLLARPAGDAAGPRVA